jgi:hypothetical protein
MSDAATRILCEQQVREGSWGVSGRGRANPLGARLVRLRGPKRIFLLVVVFLPLLRGFGTRGAEMVSRPTSDTLLSTDGFVYLLSQASFLVLSVLRHVDLPVFLRQLGKLIQLGQVSGRRARGARRALSCLLRDLRGETFFGTSREPRSKPGLAGARQLGARNVLRLG